MSADFEAGFAQALAGKAHSPLPRASWVLPGLFLAGSYPGLPGLRTEGPAALEPALSALLGAGVRRVVRLVEEREIGEGEDRLPSYDAILRALARERGLGAEILSRPIPDYGVPSCEEMEGILDAIDESLGLGLPLYLHCWGGLGRTGTVVGCWIVRRGLARRGEALVALARLRAGAENASRPSPETAGQEDFVRSWGA